MIIYSDFSKARFGNQLFFVASTIGIAKKNNTEYGFTSQMGHSGVDYQIIFENELPLTKYNPKKKYYQTNFEYQEILEDDVELIGYFQSEKFFIHCENIIRNQFKFKDNILNSVLTQYPNIKNSLTLHVRRGDYLEQPNHHPTLPSHYYKNILSMIGENYDNIFIFSDDSNWIKNNFVGDKYIFPFFEKNNDLLSFVLMSMGKDHIISNSSYGWWAAWLNENKEKKVYTPNYKQWFGPSYSNLNTEDLIPENWTQIEY